MLAVNEYMFKKNELLDEYEKRVRKWLEEKGEKEIAYKIPFFRDGITCPEVWFKPGNEFRPLFILKETSLGIDKIEELNDFLNVWGNQTRFEFVENPFDDVKVGQFTTWKKIAALAKGLEDANNGLGIREYNLKEFSYQPGEKYQGDIEGYRRYGSRTSNSLYNDIMSKIAVLEIKKIGGGTLAQKELSIATGYYSEHIEPFKDLICKQIELINPTVIIGCCREFFTANLLKDIENKTSDILWIYGYHPTMNSTKNFYYTPLNKFIQSKK